MEQQELRSYLAQRKDLEADVDPNRPLFVIHRRDGDTVDYHVRFEVGPTLKCWAIVEARRPRARTRVVELGARTTEDTDYTENFFSVSFFREFRVFRGSSGRSTRCLSARC